MHNDAQKIIVTDVMKKGKFIMTIFKSLATSGIAIIAAAVTPAMATPVVLTGNYVQVGISDHGTFGSNGNADPAFVHDPSGTGTFNPNFDYIAPGSPHDGFSMISDQFGFQSNDNYGTLGIGGFNNDFGTASPTLLTGAAANGFTNAASWTGSNGFVEITNSYFFNTGDQRVIVKSKITALTDLTSLAFGRSVDPDSDSRSYGTANSNNQRGNSLFSADDFIGSAGSVSGLTLALVNLDDGGFAHTTSINGSCCSNINPYDVLAHTGGDLGLTSSGDHGLNLAYSIGRLAKDGSVTLSYAYAVGDKIGSTGGDGAVPEPATWAMMLAGFGIIGGTMRRRQRTVVSFG